MNDKYRDLLANNLTKFRKAANLTQFELAEKLNYSDKAISKWERGEAFPDVFVLKQIADLYGITIDDLFKPDIKFRIKTAKNIMQTRSFVSAVSFIGVWFLATFIYFVLAITIPHFSDRWISFIYAIPISFLVISILYGIWKRHVLCFITASVVIWTAALSLYLSISSLLLWYIFILCIPAQAILTVVFVYKLIKARSKKVELNKHN